MKIQVLEDTPKLVRVALSGTYDPVADGGFGPKLMAIAGVEGQDVIVDMSGVSSVVTVDLGTLCNAVRVVKRKGGKFVLLKPQPAVEMILEALRLKEMLGVAADESVANSMLSEASPIAANRF